MGDEAASEAMIGQKMGEEEVQKFTTHKLYNYSVIEGSRARAFEEHLGRSQWHSRGSCSGSACQHLRQRPDRADPQAERLLAGENSGARAASKASTSADASSNATTDAASGGKRFTLRIPKFVVFIANHSYLETFFL